MFKIKKFVIRNSAFVIVFMILIMPAISLAEGLVPCDTSATCDFNALMTLVNTVIHFILFDMVIPIAAIMFAYAGFLLVTAGENTAGARTRAKDIFLNAVLGLILAAGAFLIIRTILSILGYEGDWIGFDPF